MNKYLIKRRSCTKQKVRDSQGAVNNGLIISGREVCLGHASNTSLRCPHSLTPGGGGGGHSIQLKRNNFLATPREAPSTKPTSTPQPPRESEIETDEQTEKGKSAEHVSFSSRSLLLRVPSFFKYWEFSCCLIFGGLARAPFIGWQCR